MLINLGAQMTCCSPDKEVVDFIKKNYTLPNPEYAKKERMGFWLGDTPKTIELFVKKGDDYILPYGAQTNFYDKGLLIWADMPDPAIVNFRGPEIPLYDYQEEAVEKMLAGKFGILQSAPGSGKTQMGIAIIKRLRKRALWLTHTRDLLNQSKSRAEQYIDKDLIGTITEGCVHIGKGITFATVQTMSKIDLSQYRDTWDVIIVDECHRVSGSPTNYTMFSKILNHLAARHKFGLSATVHRSDGMIKATKALLGDVVHTVPDEAIADKVMSVQIHTIDTMISQSREFLNTDGTLNHAKLLNYLAYNEERNKLICWHILNDSGPALILSDRLKQLEDIMRLLPEEELNKAVMITGKMTSKKAKAERHQALEDMRNGKKKYLFASYSLAKEGLDVPCLERLYMGTPAKDYAVIAQAIGRVARTAEGKTSARAYDFVDNIPYCQKIYRDRVRTYRKEKCELV